MEMRSGRLQQASCSQHCYCTPVVAALAYAALAYAMACAGYLLIVRCSGIGTPFRDSLTPRQEAIKDESARTRAYTFGVAVAVAVLILLLMRPIRHA